MIRWIGIEPHLRTQEKRVFGHDIDAPAGLLSERLGTQEGRER